MKKYRVIYRKNCSSDTASLEVMAESYEAARAEFSRHHYELVIDVVVAK